MNSPSIVALTGFMAAGKTTIGRALASLLGWNFVDLDAEVEHRAGLHVREIFARDGEAGFRELEAATLREVTATASSATVIALGGGTFVQPDCAAHLRACGARVVFLELPVDELLQRCGTGGDANPRPLARHKKLFRDLYAQRLPFYRKADLTVNAAAKSAAQLAHEIATALHLAGAAAAEQ